MSEYQYYEFQAIDRPLSEKEQDYIGSLSSRVDLTPARAIFTYSFGDFRANEEKVLQKYFDAMLYLANWGSTRLMFRLPRALVDNEAIDSYCVEDAVSASVVKENIILDIFIRDEGNIGGWIEGKGWLARLAPIRDDLLRGDFRVLYLAWLKVVQLQGGIETSEEDSDDEIEDEVEEYQDDYGEISIDASEPPVPANLKKLTPALKSFVELFEIDEDLLAAAAEASESSGDISEQETESLIPRLSEQERNDFLLRLTRGEPNLDISLLKRLKEISAGGSEVAERASRRRTVAELLSAASERATQKRERQRQEAEKARVRKLESLAPKQAEMWQQVSKLIDKKLPKAYDEAVRILVDLCDVARHLDESDAFQSRINKLYEDYSSRPGFLSRMRSSGLSKERA